MKFKENQNIEDWFIKKKEKDFPNNKDYVTQYKHIKHIIRTKIQNHIMVGATIAEEKKTADERNTMTGHDPIHFQQVVEMTSDILNTGDNSILLSPYEVFFLLVAIQVHDIGNILGRENHENSLFEVFNDLFQNDESIDSVEKNIYLTIASAHSGNVEGNKDKIRALMPKPSIHHNRKEIKIRLLASILRFADELADTPERASVYLYRKNKGEKNSEIYHEYADCLNSTKIEHKEHSISINYSFTKSIAKKKYQKGNKREYLLDEIFNRIIKIHYEKLYCQNFFNGYITLEHLNIMITIYSDDHAKKLKVIKLRLIESGYPSYKKITIKDICEEPETSIMADSTRMWSGKVLNEIIKQL